MSIIETFTLAVGNIWSGKMRSFLTMIGIIIGIVAVIIIVGLGNAMSSYIEKTFESMGASNLTVVISGRGDTSNTFSDDDMYAIVDANPEYLDMVSLTVSVTGVAKIGTEELSSSITGVSEEYMDIQSYTIAEGRNLFFADMEYRSKVIVIGEYINSTYFGGDSIGETININGTPYEIIGVLEAEETTSSEGGTDDCIYMPYTTATRMTMMPMTAYTVTLVDENLIDESEAIIEAALLEFYSNDDDAFTIVNMSDMIEEMQSMVNILVYILTAIAGISLLVGGIGIMNIMLVSVTERTKEIGIRKSLGAKEKYIMRQFVMEAGITSALGGVLGIILGVSLCSVATTLASSLMGDGITVTPTFNAVVLAFSISAGIGLLFGYLPAKKAAALNPIDALKYE